MISNLNSTPEIYKEFYGKIFQEMPKIIKEGRVPMNVSQLMKRRLEVQDGPAEVKTAWINNSFTTSDVIIYHPNGDVKIVLDSERLREIIIENQQNRYNLTIKEEIYQELSGEVFRRKGLQKIHDSLSVGDAKSHPIWKILARDQTLLDEYVDFIFAGAKERVSFSSAMSVDIGFLGDGYIREDKPEIRGWTIARLCDGSYSSGTDTFNSDYHRLIGIDPFLENLKNRNYSSEEVQEAKKQLEDLTNVLQPKAFSKVNNLLSKL